MSKKAWLYGQAFYYKIIGMDIEDKSKEENQDQSPMDIAQERLPTYQDMINDTKRRYLQDLMERTQ